MRWSLDLLPKNEKKCPHAGQRYWLLRLLVNQSRLLMVSNLHVGLPIRYLLLRLLVTEAVVGVGVGDKEGGEEGEEAQPGQSEEEPEKPGVAPKYKSES